MLVAADCQMSRIQGGLARVRLIVGSRKQMVVVLKLALIWTLGTGEHAFIPVNPSVGVSAGAYRMRRERCRVEGLGEWRDRRTGQEQGRFGQQFSRSFCRNVTCKVPARAAKGRHSTETPESHLTPREIERDS
jgi:hypothetical protein